MMLGAIETARKSPPVFDRLGPGIDAVFFAGCSGEILLSSSFSTLIMTIPVIDLALCATIDRNSATGSQSSEIGMCEHCDGCLTAQRSKLNGVAPRLAFASRRLVWQLRSPRGTKYKVHFEKNHRREIVPAHRTRRQSSYPFLRQRNTEPTPPYKIYETSCRGRLCRLNPKSRRRGPKMLSTQSWLRPLCRWRN